MPQLKIMLATACLAASASAWAFGDAGHLATGDVADELLRGTPVAQAVRQAAGGSLRSAAVWPDCVRNVDEAGRYRRGKQESATCRQVFESDASIGAIESYVRRNREHTKYHYVNLPFQLKEYASIPAFEDTTGHSNNTGRDIVDAINAAINRLRRRPVPPPFSLQFERETIRLLAHLIGDIHQPLHVANAFLDPGTGAVLDPASTRLTDTHLTLGGNTLYLQSGEKLHVFWDAFSTSPGTLKQLVQQARSVAPTPGPIETWAAQWASEALQNGREAFQGLTFKPVLKDAHSGKRHYHVTVPDLATYRALRDSTNRRQVSLAGARLAQILQRIYGTE